MILRVDWRLYWLLYIFPDTIQPATRGEDPDGGPNGLGGRIDHHTSSIFSDILSPEDVLWIYVGANFHRYSYKH